MDTARNIKDVSQKVINTNTTEKKNTQTNQSKKAVIQSILEKYNLKPSKKSKTNAIPTNFEIKPSANIGLVIWRLKCFYERLA